MTIRDIATLFVDTYADDIKEKLQIKNFDRDVAIKAAGTFISKNKKFIEHQVKNSAEFLNNRGLVADIIGSMYESLVPAEIRKARENVAKEKTKTFLSGLSVILGTSLKQALEADQDEPVPEELINHDLGILKNHLERK